VVWLNISFRASEVNSGTQAGTQAGLRPSASCGGGELKDGKVKLDGDNVVEFHKLPEFQQVTLKVLRWEERDKRLVIKEAQMVA
jgi:hypothetical protein